MAPKKIYSTEFSDLFNGKIVFDDDIKSKLFNKHKVYEGDVADALGDPYLVVVKSRQGSPAPKGIRASKGTVYEIFAETETGRVLFIVGRLFPDGNLYIITSYWAEDEMEKFYYKESELLRDG